MHDDMITWTPYGITPASGGQAMKRLGRRCHFSFVGVRSTTTHHSASSRSGCAGRYHMAATARILKPSPPRRTARTRPWSTASRGSASTRFQQTSGPRLHDS